MDDRDQLIRRKNEVIRDQAALRRRLEAARTGSSRQHQQTAALEAELQCLQREEHRLRLLIDRTPPTSTLPQLRPQIDPMQTRFDAFITAGYDRTRSDPLTGTTGKPHKVLVEVAGAPMIWHVVQALQESDVVDELAIVGLAPDLAPDFGRPVHFVEDHGSLWANQKAGFEAMASLRAENRYVLTVSADMPLLTGEMVRWFVDACRPLEKGAYWGLVRKEVMEAAFPNSRRSYLPLSEGQFCSGDLFLSDLQEALRVQSYLESILASRKSALRQIRFLGISALLRLLFRRLTLDWLLDLVERRVGLTGRAIFLPFAEVGMDVDKPHQLVQVEEYLRTHPHHPANHRRSTPTQRDAFSP